MKIEFEKLNWPKSHRIEALAEVLPKGILLKLILYFSERPEKERMFKLPKRQTILKVIAFHYGQKIDKGETTWDEVMKALKAEYGTLKAIGIDRMYMRKLYKQRRREVVREAIKK